MAWLQASCPSAASTAATRARLAAIASSRTISLEGSPAVDAVRQIYAVHVAPQEAILAAKVHPTRT
jgi:hypothetical protein